MMNVGLSVKNQMIWVLAKRIICGIPVCMAASVTRHVKLMNLCSKNCSCKKRLIGNLVLACQDETLNTTETSLDDKNPTCEKCNCLPHTTSLVTIWFSYKITIIQQIG